MFQPTDYQAKRNAMNEILLQQLSGVLMSVLPPANKPHVQQMLEQYGRGQQILRDKEAERILGPVVHEVGNVYATAATFLNYLKANVGRTYFGTEEPTGAPPGSIGTSDFGMRFKEWLASLPDYDLALNPNMQSGFYRDNSSGGPNVSIPLLAIRKGNELTVVVFRTYVSVMTLNLDQIPADYPWTNHTHYALRGELFSYRSNVTIPELEQELRTVLAAHGIDSLQIPTDVGDVIAVGRSPEPPVPGDTEEVELEIETDDVEVDESGLEREELEDDIPGSGDENVEASTAESPSAGRGNTSCILHVDGAGFVPPDVTDATQ